MPPANFSEAHLLDEEDYKCFFEAIRSSPWKLQDRQEIIDEFVDCKKTGVQVGAFEFLDEVKQPEAKAKAIRIKRQVPREVSSFTNFGSVNGSHQENRIQPIATKIKESPFVSSKKLIKIVSNHLSKVKQPVVGFKPALANHQRRISANSNHLSSEDMRGRSVSRNDLMAEKKPFKRAQTDIGESEKPRQQSSTVRSRQSEDEEGEEPSDSRIQSAARLPRRCRRGQSLYLEREAKSIHVNEIVQEMLEGEEASPVKQTPNPKPCPETNPSHKPALQTQVEHSAKLSDLAGRCRTRTTENFYKKIKACSKEASRADSLPRKRVTRELQVGAFSAMEPLLPTEPQTAQEHDRARSISGTRRMLQKGVFTIIQQTTCANKLKASVRDRQVPDRFAEAVPANSVALPLAKINLNDHVQHLNPAKGEAAPDLEDAGKPDRSAPPSSRHPSLSGAQRAENIVRLNGYQIVFNKGITANKSSIRNFTKPPQAKQPLASPAPPTGSVNSSVTKADCRDKSFPKHPASSKTQDQAPPAHRASFALNLESKLGKSISPMLGKVQLGSLLKKVPAPLHPGTEAFEPPQNPPAEPQTGAQCLSKNLNPLSSLGFKNQSNQPSQQKRFDTLIKSFHKTQEASKRHLSTDKENSQRLAMLEALKNLIPKPGAQK